MNLIQKIASKLGAFTTRKHGEEFTFACPKCHREKLEINPKKKMFHCFRCGYKGVLQQILDDLMIQAEDAQDKMVLPIFPTLRTNEVRPTVVPGWREEMPLNTVRFLGFKRISVLEKQGKWGGSTDPRLRDRLVIPIVEDGLTVSYVARSVDGREPKEISGPNKSHYLYNLDDVEEGDGVVIVEGIFDCEAVARAGYKCVAILGSNISDVQIGKLLAKKPGIIVLMLDGDLAGYEGAIKAHRKFAARSGPLIFNVSPGDDKDPDDLSVEELRAALGDLLPFDERSKPPNLPA